MSARSVSPAPQPEGILTHSWASECTSQSQELEASDPPRYSSIQKPGASSPLRKGRGHVASHRTLSSNGHVRWEKGSAWSVLQSEEF